MPHFTAPDGAQIYYDDTGQGAPILMLSGLTRNSSDFDYVMPHLTRNRLIRMDYRGRGQSDHTGAETYTIPNEANDALALMDHLNLDKTAILGTSRGGLIAMTLAITAKPRLTAVALNDIGPVLEESGLDTIRQYIGRRPAQRTFQELAQARATLMAGFDGVPHSRWMEEAHKHYRAENGRLEINYDPDLRKIFNSDPGPLSDLWPLFDAMSDLPLCTLRGENSDILSTETLTEMQRRRPDMITAVVPDRGHVPFLDEPAALKALHTWTEQF